MPKGKWPGTTRRAVTRSDLITGSAGQSAWLAWASWPSTKPFDRTDTDCCEVTLVGTMGHCDPSREPENLRETDRIVRVFLQRLW